MTWSVSPSLSPFTIYFCIPDNRKWLMWNPMRVNFGLFVLKIELANNCKFSKMMQIWNLIQCLGAMTEWWDFAIFSLTCHLHEHIITMTSHCIMVIGKSCISLTLSMHDITWGFASLVSLDTSTSDFATSYPGSYLRPHAPHPHARGDFVG